MEDILKSVSTHIYNDNDNDNNNYKDDRNNRLCYILLSLVYF